MGAQGTYVEGRTGACSVRQRKEIPTPATHTRFEKHGQEGGIMLLCPPTHPPTAPHRTPQPNHSLRPQAHHVPNRRVAGTVHPPTQPIHPSRNTQTYHPNPPTPPQCLYYLVEGGILEGFNLIFGTDVSLTQIFTPKGLEMESAEGLLNMVALLLSFVAGYVRSGLGGVGWGGVGGVGGETCLSFFFLLFVPLTYA